MCFNMYFVLCICDHFTTSSFCRSFNKYIQSVYLNLFYFTIMTNICFKYLHPMSVPGRNIVPEAKRILFDIRCRVLIVQVGQVHAIRVQNGEDGI